MKTVVKITDVVVGVSCFLLSVAIIPAFMGTNTGQDVCDPTEGGINWWGFGPCELTAFGWKMTAIGFILPFTILLASYAALRWILSKVYLRRL